ncbi:MAG TPA: prenyltransferase [Xanthobacteraceae bacterium]|nr:prenyltransferase [Xanthobacteraceae bacterium]
MPDFPIKILSPDEIESLEREIIEEAQAGSKEVAWHKAQPLRKAQHHQREAAISLLRILDHQCLPIEGAVDVLLEIARAHDQDVRILAALGGTLDVVRDINDLNASPPPADTVFYTVVERLAALAKKHAGLPEEEFILHGLGTSARMLARQSDEIAEMSYRKLIEINPRKSANHYNLGLFYKTRGRFEEGMKSNQTAASLTDGQDESTEWNLGICATGAGNGAVALDVWKRMGQKIEMGRFGLPEGSYSTCKVKLAERPLAQRTADVDDPGLEETVWIERLSPCHGIIRSVLYESLGVDYGDIILIDGAPITHHTYGDTKVPVFPHLATLIRRNYRFFDFAGTQDKGGQLSDASIDLDEDTVIYPHSEYLRILCATCWRDPDIDHENHESEEKHVVIGRIAAPGNVDPVHLLGRIDNALAKRGRCQLYAPDLCAAAGLETRALVDKRRFELLTGNTLLP